jgi:hypothetical protein
MSTDLLTALNRKEPYLQSPVDDLWSFFYVGQWAAANNDDPKKPPKYLPELRNNLISSLNDRTAATTIVTGRRKLKASDYGAFLANSRSVLAPWHSQLEELSIAWENDTCDFPPEIEGRYERYYPLFKKYTRKAVLEYLRLVGEMPSSLDEAG